MLEGWRSAAKVTAHLADVINHGECIRQDTHHCNNNKDGALMCPRPFRMAISSEGLKKFGVHTPAFAPQLIYEGGCAGADINIAGIVVGSFFEGRALALDSLVVFFLYDHLVLLFNS